MKRILFLIISLGLIFGLVGVGTQAYFTDTTMYGVNTFKAGVWVYTITATAGEGGSIDPSGDVEVVEGENQTFDIIPDDTFEITDVIVDNESLGVRESYTFENVIGNHTIHAEFTLKEYDLKIGSSDGGSVTERGEGTFTYEHGTVVDLEAEAEEGYEFDGWTGDIGTVDDPNSASTTIEMLGEYSITANFETINQEYDLDISSTPGGTVEEPGEGSFTYSAGTVVELEVKTDRGYEFEGWTGDTATIEGSSDLETSITINDYYSITAVFSNIIITGERDISVSEELDLRADFHPGGVNRSQWFIKYMDCGEPVWEGHDEPETGSGNSSEFKFEGGTAGTYVVEFRIWHSGTPDQYQSKSVTINVTDNSSQTMTKAETSIFTISATSGDGGSISEEGENIINPGEDKKFTITPTEGHRIEDVTVDGGSVGAVSEYTFTDISADHTIHVLFSPIDQSAVTITFDANGGDPEIQTKEVEQGKKAGSPPEVSMEGHVCTGWNTQADGSGEDFNPETEVTVDFTVYAQWKEEDNNPEEENDDNHSSNAAFEEKNENSNNSEDDDFDNNDINAKNEEI